MMKQIFNKRLAFGITCFTAYACNQGEDLKEGKFGNAPAISQTIMKEGINATHAFLFHVTNLDDINILSEQIKKYGNSHSENDLKTIYIIAKKLSSNTEDVLSDTIDNLPFPFLARECNIFKVDALTNLKVIEALEDFLQELIDKMDCDHRFINPIKKYIEDFKKNNNDSHYNFIGPHINNLFSKAYKSLYLLDLDRSTITFEALNQTDSDDLIDYSLRRLKLIDGHHKLKMLHSNVYNSYMRAIIKSINLTELNDLGSFMSLILGTEKLSKDKPIDTSIPLYKMIADDYKFQLETLNNILKELEQFKEQDYKPENHNAKKYFIESIKNSEANFNITKQFKVENFINFIKDCQ